MKNLDGSIPTDEDLKNKKCFKVPNTVYIIDLIAIPLWNSWQAGEERVHKRAGFFVVEVDDPDADTARTVFSNIDAHGVVVLAHGDADKKGTFVASDDRLVGPPVAVNHRLAGLKLIVCWAAQQETDWRSMVSSNGYFYARANRIYAVEAWGGGYGFE